MVWAHTVPARAATALLSPAECDRLRRIHSPAEADRYAAAHTLLRLVVGQRTGRSPGALQLTARCRTCGGAHGRPELIGHPRVQLSLAHAGQRVAVALGHGAGLGVDVEQVSATGFDGFEQVALNPAERAGSPAERARTWVRKEALLKATGRGLTVEPSSVVLTAPDEPPRLLRWGAHDPPGPVRLTDLDVGAGHAGCLAVLTSQTPEVVLTEHVW